MNIESVNKDLYIPSQKATTQKNTNEQVSNSDSMRTNPRTDRLELSYLAIKFKPIREKLKSGEYSKPEVIRDVASKISQEIAAPTKINK